MASNTKKAKVRKKNREDKLVTARRKKEAKRSAQELAAMEASK